MPGDTAGPGAAGAPDPSVEREHLIARIEQAAAESLRRTRFAYRSYVVGSVLLVGLYVAGWFGWAFPGDGGRPLWWDGLRVGLLAFLVLLTLSGRRRRARFTRLRADDAAGVRDLLLDSVMTPDAPEDHWKLLALLLKDVKVSDEADFTDRRRAVLRRIVRERAYRADLRLAALNALCEVADARSAEFIAMVANWRAGSGIAKHLRRRARQRLPEVRAGLAQRAETGHLLRPADASDDGMLLRPAAGVSLGDDDRLVRPALAQRTDAGPADRQS